MSPSVRRIVLLSLAGGVLFDALVPGNAAGLNAPLVMGAFLGAALLVSGRDGLRRMDPADAWLGPVALVLASMAVLRADDWLVTADLLVAAALAAGMIGCLAGGRITRGLVPQVLNLAVDAVAATVAGAASLLTRRDPVRSVDTDRIGGRLARVRLRLRPAAPVARGLVVAVPLVMVFAILFSAADAVFARLASEVLSWQPDIDLADLMTRAFVVTLVAWGAAGLLGLGAGLLPFLASRPADTIAVAGPASSAPGAAGANAATRGAGPAAAPGDAALQGAPPAPPASAWAPVAPGGAAATWSNQPGAAWPGATAWPAAHAAPRSPLRLGVVEAATILLVVDALFAVFVGLQLAYLFGGRDTLALAGLTYAEYARRGFFELVMVAVLAGLLAVTLDLAAERRSRIQLGGALLLLGLTAVVLASALVRLRLYQEAYGWTELRFVVLTAIGWLAVALAVTATLLLRRQTRWVLHALGVLVLVTLAGMNVVGPQAFVAERNLERAIDPSLVPPGGRTGLDAGYLRELGDEAIAPTVAAWGRLDEASRAELARVLERREQELATDPAIQGWPAWNLTRERAREALRAWEATTGAASR